MNVRHIAILITADKANVETSQTAQEANLTKQAGIEIFVVGITSNVNIQELNQIASQPLNEHLYFVGDYNLLDTIYNPLVMGLCNGQGLTAAASPVASSNTGAGNGVAIGDVSTTQGSNELSESTSSTPGGMPTGAASSTPGNTLSGNATVMTGVVATPSSGNQTGVAATNPGGNSSVGTKPVASTTSSGTPTTAIIGSPIIVTWVPTPAQGVNAVAGTGHVCSTVKKQ